MRVLLAIKGLAVEGGGAERVFAQLATGLHARGHQVQIVTFDAPGAGSYYDLPEAIPQLGLNISPVGQPTSRSALPRGMWALRRFARRMKPDVVVAFMHSTYVPVALALAGTGLPVVVSEHIDGAHFRDRPMQRRAADLALRFAKLKTVPTSAIEAEQLGRAAGMTVTMPNPIDLETFAPQPMETAQPVILSVGRFMAQKDFPTLISAFARLAPEFPDWRLRIAGDGELRPELEAAVEATGLSERIELPGMISDMPAEYGRAGLFVLPSLYESFGLVTAEALASGRPVIGFADCLGTAALINPPSSTEGVGQDNTQKQNGLLVDPGSDRVQALAEGLRRLMADDALRARIGAAGPASVSHFALEAIIDQWESLLERLAKGETPG